MNRNRENWTERLISRHLRQTKMSVVIMKEGGNSTSFNFLLCCSSLCRRGGLHGHGAARRHHEPGRR